MADLQEIKDEELLGMVMSTKIVVTTAIPEKVYKKIKEKCTLSDWIVERFVEWMQKP